MPERGEFIFVLFATFLGSTLILLGTRGAAQLHPPQQIVEQAVHTELAADASDHSRWLYYEIDRKPGHTVKQWVAETPKGDLDCVMDRNGQPINNQERRIRMEDFMHDQSAQEKRRQSNQHDDQQAAEMLKLLPHAFIWTETASSGKDITLHFRPDPKFHPPNREARVFAAMEGDMTVDKAGHRIVSLKGRMIREVKFFGGLLGELDAGGTFDVERRNTGNGEWQITQTHVHIHGRALLFKSISDEEDDNKSKFKELPENISFHQAEKQLLEEHP